MNIMTMNSITINRIATFYKTNGSNLSSDMVHLSAQKTVLAPGDSSADFFRIQRNEQQMQDVKRSRQQIGDAIALIDVAEKAGTYVFEDLRQMKALVKRYHDPQASQDEKNGLAAEFDQIKQRITDSISTTTYDGRQLIADSSSNPLATIQLDSTNLSNTYEVEFAATDIVDVSSLDISAGGDEAAATELINAQIEHAGSYNAKISAYRRGLGAQDAILENKSQQNENINEVIGGVDNISTLARMMNGYIRQQSASAMFMQANLSSQNILKLFQ
ncbi:MAG: hypothetical protein JW795_11005 [Chitinivibrionales bacterium]|nr:hypothetical protein [Chitinivibrionales bacterium]